MRYRGMLGKNGLLTGVAVSGGLLLKGRRRIGSGLLGRARGRPVVVEINRTPADLPSERSAWPEPLSGLAERAHVYLDPTPGRPTMSLRATPRKTRDDIRRAVRETKQLLETGEVLRSPAIAEPEAASGRRGGWR
jgi:hypothetical protein